MTISLQLSDNVEETITVTGTGLITCSGVSPTGARPFSSVMTTGNYTWYCITDTVTGDWEVQGSPASIWTSGGSYGTLARGAPLASSNGDALVSFAGNPCKVFMDIPAAMAAMAAGAVQSGGPLGTPSSGVATNLTGTAAGMSVGGNAATASALPGGTTNPAVGNAGNYGSVASTGASATVTISHASPAVVTWASSNLQNGSVVFFTGGTLPTGLVANTNYYVVNATANTFEVSATPGGTAINTTSAGSGTHTATSGASLTSGTEQPVAAILFPAGNFVVRGNILFTAAGTTVASAFGAMISTSASGGSATQGAAYLPLSVTGDAPQMPTGSVRLSFSTPTLVYLNAYASFTTSTMVANGALEYVRTP